MSDSDVVYRYYVVFYSEKDSHHYRKNGTLGVIAEDVLQAIRIAQQLKPGSTVWNISHHGIVHAIAEDARWLAVSCDPWRP
jgi:1,2-phenylacetyl-CoA epoxidase PaaB subunit